MNRFLPFLLLTTLSGALAHTEVTVVSPVATQAAAPNVVQLRFSEPVNLRFSTFRVVALRVGRTPEATARWALGLKTDAPELINTGARPSGMAAQLSLPLKAGLKPGSYVIAWAVLSEDGHPVRGQRLFRVK